MKLHLTLKGGEGSGWHAPPKGTHSGEEHRSVGSGRASGATEGAAPEGWRTGVDGNFYNNAGITIVKVGQGDDGWFFEPKKKGFNIRHLRQSGISRDDAIAAGKKFLADHPGVGQYKVSYTTKGLKQKSKRVSARSANQAEEEVRAWMKDFFRFSGDRTSRVMR